MKLSNYQAPREQNWSGRLDSAAQERFFQIIKLIDLNSTYLPVRKLFRARRFCLRRRN